MTGGFRQSMTWLHTWGGLVFGWFLSVIFVAGTICVFNSSISQWMRAMPALSTTEQRVQAVEHAARYIEQQQPSPGRWNIYLPDQSVSWQDGSGERREGHFDPVNGGPRRAGTARESHGGYHFVALHYKLHSDLPGIMLVGFVTMVMLAALVTGVIIHRRIFKDIFTLRLFKGQRSWLDGHNVASVLTLPFQLMIAYTGLALFHYAYMPGAIAHHYGMPGGLQGQFDHVGPYFEARRDGSTPPAPPAAADVPLSAMPALVREAEQRSGRPVEWLSRQADRRTGVVRVRIGMSNRGSEPLPRPPAVTYQVTGSPARLVQQQGAEKGVGETSLDVMGALHEARFGGWTVKWLWFLSGIAGCVMIATGLVLFTVKRRVRGIDEFGAASPAVFRAVDGLNVAAVSGVALASIAYFWANRLLPVDLPARVAAEVTAFFIVWGLTLLHGLTRPKRAWAEQFGLAAAMCLALPVLNAATTGDWFWRQAARGNWEVFGVEVTVMAVGLSLAALAFRLARGRP